MKNDELLFNFYERFPELRGKGIEKAFSILLSSCQSGHKILICGNGGSSSDSDHIVGELMKAFCLPRTLPEEEKKKFPPEIALKLQKAIPAISLSAHSGLLTAIGNDVSFDMVYAQQVYGYGEEGDVLIGLSTSGNSLDVVNATYVAKGKGMKTISITGEKESKLSAISDITLRLPSTETYRIQEYTLPIYHLLCLMLENALFGDEK